MIRIGNFISENNMKEFKGFEQVNDIIRLLNHFSGCILEKELEERKGYTKLLEGKNWFLGQIYWTSKCN